MKSKHEYWSRVYAKKQKNQDDLWYRICKADRYLIMLAGIVIQSQTGPVAQEVALVVILGLSYYT